MSSKLYRQGTSKTTAWQPLAKGVPVTPVFAGAAPKQSPAEPPATELQQQIRDLERRLNEERQSAYQRGLQEGQAQGQQLATQYQAALERLSRTIEEIASARPRMRHEAEEDVVKLAMAIARRILYREINADPAALLGLVRAALDKIDGRGVQRARANPQDAAVLQQHLQQMGLPFKIDVLADPSLSRGSAIFETNYGFLDASVDTQLNEIERGFADLVRRSK